MSISLPFGPNDKILEIGGGDNPLFHPNLDIRQLPTVDIVHDTMNFPWPVPDASFDGVFAKFFIEHPSWRVSAKLIAEMARILKTGGKMILIGPNTLEQCREITRRNRITIEEAAMLFGGQEEGDWNTHRAAFSPDYMTALCQQAGFSDIKIQPLGNVITDMIVVATKGSANFATIQNAQWYKELEATLVQRPPDLRLNLGSFTVMWKNWTNVDILPMEEYAKQNSFYFVRHDLRKPLPWKDGEAKAIYCSHTAEHLLRKEGTALLKECCRVLETGGIARFAIPDAAKIAKAYLDGSIMSWTFNEGVKNAEDPADAFWQLLTAGHVTAYDAASIKQKMEEAGFSPVIIKEAESYTNAAAFLFTKDMFPELSSYVEGIKPERPVERPLKICLISTPFVKTPPDRYGGLEQVVHDLGLELAKMGHTVTVVGAKGSKVPGCKMIETLEPANKVDVNWLEWEQAAFDIYKDSLTGFDIIHDNTWMGFAYFAKQANPSLKVVHTHHGHLSWRGKPFEKMNLIAISDWMVRVYNSLGWAAKRAYNGVDLSRYKFQEQKGNRLLFVGRLDTFKQPDVAIGAARKLGIGLDLVGGSFVQDLNFLEQVKKNCDVVIPSGDDPAKYPFKETDIVLHLDASQEEKVRLYQNAKAVLFPSRMGEPFGLIVPEANSCGTFVIGLRDGAIPETIEEGVSGFVVGELITQQETTAEQILARKVRDIDALVEGVKRMSTIKLVPEAISKRGQLFSRESMAKAYLALYREVVKGNEW